MQRVRHILSKRPFRFTYLNTTASTVDATSYTFSGRDLSTPRGDRTIIVAVAGRSSGAPSISSATIQGVPATVITQLTSGNNFVGIIAAPVPSGSSGDVFIDFGGVTMLRCGIAVYSKLGGRLDAFATATSTASNPTATLVVPAYGIALGVTVTATITSHTTAGLTENVDSQIGAEGATMAMGSTQPGEIIGSSTFTFTPASGVSPIGAFATWANN